MSRLQFVLEAQASQSHARATTFRTLHGEVKTPVFMPVGTQATVKNQSFSSLKEAGSQVLLANTYHLMLRPGAEVFKKFGGIHKFMNWGGSVLTDSGGYQIFSLPHSRSMTEEGAEFQSYVDGRRILLTPELSIGTQKAIGSDIMMVLDQCIPSTSDHATAKAAMELTHRWAKRSLEARGDSPQSMFGIVQGACFIDLRKQSADFLSQLPFDGFAVGGLAVGESKAEREDFTELTAQLLPKHLPRYLMGVGTPIDILEAVHRGIDMFDCIIPTSYAQRGVAFTSIGRLQLRRSVYKFSDEKLDAACKCNTCQTHSRAYLHHLIKTDETLGWQLLGAHNIFFYHQLMREIRQSIFDDTFSSFYQAKRQTLAQAEEENPVTPPKLRKKRTSRNPVPILGDYQVVISEEKTVQVCHIPSGEILHTVRRSVSEPKMEEEQSDILNKLKRKLAEDNAHPLIIWDIGIGVGAHAMTAIRYYEETNPARPLHIYSFETNLDALRLAMKHSYAFTHLRHGAPVALLEESKWNSKTHSLTWTLLEGTFVERAKDAPPPDLSYFEPVHFKLNSSIWKEDESVRVKANEGGTTSLSVNERNMASFSSLNLS